MECVFVKGGKAMRVSQERLDARHQVSLWIYKQGDANNSVELVWALDRIIGELHRLNQGGQGQQSLHRLLGAIH